MKGYSFQFYMLTRVFLDDKIIKIPRYAHDYFQYCKDIYTSDKQNLINFVTGCGIL